MLTLKGFGEIQAVGLDLDGTLIFTEPLNIEASLVACEEAGLERPRDVEGLVVGNTNAAFFTEVLRSAGREVSPGLVSRLSARKREYFAQNIHRAEAVPGAVEFVRALQGRVLLGLVTASSNMSMSAALAHLGLECEAFNLLLPADALCSGKQPKPHSDHWTEAARLMGMSSCLLQMLAVEDALKGVESAVGAGVLVGGITTTCPAKILLGAGVDFTFDSFAELAARLGVELAV